MGISHQKWRGTPMPSTPRPPTPQLSLDDRCSDEDDDISKTGKEQTWWQPVLDGLKHRGTTISGWVVVPRSVVMATTLNRKHEEGLRDGRLSTIHKIVERRAQQLNDLKLRNNRRWRQLPHKIQVDRSSNGLYNHLLEENLLDIEARVKAQRRMAKERYQIVSPRLLNDDSTQASCSTAMNEEKETQQLERALPLWKRSFILESADVVSYKNNHDSRLMRKIRQDRPLTADSSLQSQSEKASQAAHQRPLEDPCNLKVAKMLHSRRMRSADGCRRRCPASTTIVIRNSNNTEYMTLSPRERPIMTSHTAWKPLSFDHSAHGDLVRIKSDLYGYQSIAEYMELCRSLNDGMVMLEQTVEVGDSIRVKIISTDRRMGLMYAAMTEQKAYCEDNKVPCNRLESNDNFVTTKWQYSYEISNLKPGNEMRLTRDALGRLKCSLDGASPQVILQLQDSKPRHLALCLGLGVAKIQLLGCYKNCRDLLCVKNAYEIDTSGVQTRSTIGCKDCSFCGTHKDWNHSPYACGHIAVCPSCRGNVECWMCAAPLCWTSCPLCDTRM